LEREDPEVRDQGLRSVHVSNLSCFNIKIYMLPRKASYKTIFGAQQKDLLSLNAFSEAVADDEKYRLPEGISIRRVE